MAETTTITRPAPIIEGSLTAFLKSIDKLGAGAIPAAGFTGIDTSKFAPTIAAESQLQKDRGSEAKFAEDKMQRALERGFYDPGNRTIDPFQAAGGGIAKEAGDSSGRPPESGPQPQGLLSLKNRVRNY